MHDNDTVECGSIVPQEFDMTPYARCMRNKTEGVETITFAKGDWQLLDTYLTALQARVIALNALTPVEHAHGLCKVTVCQWGELSGMRAKYAIDHEKLPKLYTIAEQALTLVDRLIEEKLIAVEGWWSRKVALIRCEIEDMKRK